MIASFTTGVKVAAARGCITNGINFIEEELEKRIDVDGIED